MHNKFATQSSSLGISLFFAIIFCLALPLSADDKDKTPKPQSKCPITGQTLAKQANPQRVEYEGFYFFVAEGVTTEQLNEKIVEGNIFKILAKNKDAAEPISQVCPQMGKKTLPNLYVEKDGRRIHVCCKGCLKPVEKNWDKMLEKVKKQAEQGDPQEIPGM